MEETPLHVRQTGHVTVDVELLTSTHCESCCLVQQMISVAITDALKNVDCDLPPLEELCGEPQVSVKKFRKNISSLPLYSYGMILRSNSSSIPLARNALP